MYVAIIETKYRIVALAATPEDAKRAAVLTYRRGIRQGAILPTAGVETNEQIIDYFGINVYGPVTVNTGVIE